MFIWKDIVPMRKDSLTNSKGQNTVFFVEDDVPLWREIPTKKVQAYVEFVVFLPNQTKLQRTWTDVRIDDPNKTMLEWLSTFYDVILSTWHTEVWLSTSGVETHDSLSYWLV